LPEKAQAKSYSQNARNLDRLNSGDTSGGSIYDNNPKTEGSRKRRALTGCKVALSRTEAAKELHMTLLSEKECNQKVLNGETEFMLAVLRRLDCPTCAYGIGPSSNEH
jgi:hypothetical protein